MADAGTTACMVIHHRDLGHGFTHFDSPGCGCSPYIECTACGNSGFSGYGSGYGEVCFECGGQSAYKGNTP